MTKIFTLTPTVKKIIEGRNNGSMKLVCSAPKCLHAVEKIKDIKKDLSDTDKIIFSHDELNAIQVKGHVKCPKCGFKAVYGEAVEYNENQLNDKKRYRASERMLKVKCPKCGHAAKRVWTQKVVSRHINNSHKFYHEECWDALHY